MTWGRAPKYRAVRTFVSLPDGTLFTRDDLLRLALARRVAATRLVEHRQGPPTAEPLTLKALATAVGLKGEAFDSKVEARRYVNLLLEERAGRLTDLRRQVPFPLHAPGGDVIATYRPDFVYVRDNQTVVEDVKGFRTKEFRRTKKHVEAEYGVVVTEVRRA